MNDPLESILWLQSIAIGITLLYPHTTVIGSSLHDITPTINVYTPWNTKYFYCTHTKQWVSDRDTYPGDRTWNNLNKENTYLERCFTAQRWWNVDPLNSFSNGNTENGIKNIHWINHFYSLLKNKFIDNALMPAAPNAREATLENDGKWTIRIY